MKNFMKKSVSVLMIVVMCLTMAPLQGFVGVDFSSWFASEAKAAYAPDSGETYWAMNHDEALGFIAFIYDTGKVTDDMMNAGNLYAFLTGGFERGSIEELCAKISFLATARTNISQCINNYSAVMNNAYSSLLEYLIEQANGDIDDGLANSTLDSVKDSIKSVILTLGNASETVLENLEYISSAYSSISSIEGKVEKLKAGINALNYTLSSASKAPYEYIRTYISNFSISDSLSDVDGVAEIIEGYNSVIKMDEGGKLSGAFLFYGNDNKVEQVESYGRFIYYVTKSLESSGVYVDSSGAVKIVQVHCPTDVYVYDTKTDKQLLSIINDNITVYDNCVLATVCNSEKLIVLPQGQEYTVNIVATDNGTMDYIVTEYLDSAFLREVNYLNVELEKNEQFKSNIPEQVQVPASEYNLKKNNGEEIEFSEDSLPPVNDNIVDVIVAEELFDGFPIEIINLVADTMFNMKSVVDLSAYDISTDDAVALFSAVAKYYPAEYSLIANSDFTYKIIVSPNLDRIMKIRFYYGDDANLDTYQKRVKDLNAEIEVLAEKVEGMNEFEKALYIHDYIVLNCEYDLELLEILETNGTLTGELRSERYTEYSVLVNGTGICGSYALAYRAILNAAGMECLYLSSSQMNHAWNLVKIDGKWYHVDCCWDDPVPDTYGQARRTYFLRTDKEIMDLNHYSWTPGQYKANSEKYSEMPRNYDTKQKYDDGKWYYLEGTTLYSSDEYGKNETEITSISASSIDVDDGDIYYSNGRWIYKYDTKNSKSLLMYQIPKAKSGSKIDKAYIKNMYVDNSVVEYYKSVYDSEGKSKTIYEVGVLDADSYSTITNIELDKIELTLDVFETDKLNANIVTNNSIVPDVELTWLSSNEMVATVDELGNVIAKNTGSTTISVQIGHIITTCELTVTGNGLKGSCGDTTKWEYDKYTNTLKVFGYGKMLDFTTDNTIYSTGCTPWYNFIDEIRKINVEIGVTSIGRSAFAQCENLNSVTISETVIQIGEYAFFECKKLTNIKIPDNVTNLGSGVFWNCSSLESVSLSDNITSIESSLFQKCYSLKSISIPQNVKSIGMCAFFDCSSLESVYIPKNVSLIEVNAFGGESYSLNSIIVSENNGYYSSDKYGVLYNKNQSNLIRYPIGNIREQFDVPNSVKTIEICAFKNCVTLQKINIPASVNTIEEEAFKSCINLESITLPEGITAVSNKVFYGCENLLSVSLPSTITAIEYSAFQNCEMLSDLTIPNKVVAIENGAFSNTNLSRVSIPSSVQSVESNAFSHCDSLEYVYLGDGVNDLSSAAFLGCNNLSRINISSYNNTYSVIDGVLFSKDKTKLIIYPSGRLDESYIIPDGVVAVYDYAFNSCNNLRQLTISKDVEVLEAIFSGMNFAKTWLGPDLFSMCDGLVDIIVDVENSCFSSEDGVLYNKDKSLLIKYPNNKSNVVYRVPGFVANISPAAFSGTKNLISLIIPDNIKEMSQELCMFSYKNDSLRYLFLEGNTNLYFSQLNGYSSLEKVYSVNGKKPFLFFSSIDKNIILYGRTGTETESYALNNGNTFIDVNANPHIHDYFLMGYLEPTETEDGYELWECYCRKDSYKTILHYYGEETTTTPSCVIDGNKFKTCLNCGEVATIETIPAIGKHDYKLVSTVSGDCTTPPVYTYTCSACSDTYTEEGKIEDGHNYETTVVSPTCEEKGYTKEVCTICGETLLSDFTSPKGHEFVINRPDGYCSAHDTLEYSCKICSYKEFVSADSANLATETVTVDPTCTKSGSKTEICTLCKATISTEILNPLSHDYAEEFTVDKAATCTTEGSKSQHCTRCDAKRAVTVIEATGHQNTSVINAVESTCTENGYSGDTFCSDCSSIIANGASTDKLSHTESDWITDRASTCTAEGSKHTECTECSEVIKTEVIVKLSHDYTTVVTKATCENGGYTTYTCCNCSYSYKSDNTPATGHNYVDGVCTACGESKIDNCSHMCHKSGFMGFIWKIVRFFWKLFGMNPVCDCGVAHY